MTTNPTDIDFSEPHLVIETQRRGKKYIFVVLDNDIAKRLGVTEDDTRFSQTIADNGDVILKLVRRPTA